jgi:hypothetical protein
MDVATARELLDWEAFDGTPLTHEPFAFIVVPGFVRPEAASAACAGFPGADLPGVLPAPKRVKDDAFGRLLTTLRSDRVTRMVGRKFGLNLSTDTLMTTLRARCRSHDGRIHTDTPTKVVTGLIYLNDGWADDGGRLRLLRGPDNIEDMIAEVPPLAGTLIAFRVSPHSWHGHKPFEGMRRSIMLNWMVDAAAARRETAKHALSAGFKSLFA